MNFTPYGVNILQALQLIFRIKTIFPHQYRKVDNPLDLFEVKCNFTTFHWGTGDVTRRIMATDIFVYFDIFHTQLDREYDLQR